MKIIIQGLLDITDATADRGKEGARFTEITGTLTPERQFIVNDIDGNLSPWNPDGLLNPNNYGWQNNEIEIFDDDNILIYSGLITDIKENENAKLKQLIIPSRAAIGNLLQYPIEENDKQTYIDFELNGDHGKGTSQILIKSGSTVIPDICIMSYSDSLIPNYQVTNPQGDPTVNFDIDRGLEADLFDGQPLTISAPIFKTAPDAVKDILNLAFARIGKTNKVNDALFDGLANEAAANNRYISFYIRLEDKINLGQHLRNISELTELYIRPGADGRIEPVDGIAWNGINPLYDINEEIIIYPTSKDYDRSRLLYGYDMPWINGDLVELEKYNLPDLDPRLIEWEATAILRPKTLKDILAIKNNYLFNNQATAKYYGDRRINYYSEAREVFKCNLWKFYANGEPIRLKLFDVFLLNYQNYINEPVRCIGYDINEESGLYQNVLFELINNPFPDLPKP